MDPFATPDGVEVLTSDVARAWHVDGITYLEVCVARADGRAVEVFTQMRHAVTPDGHACLLFADNRKLRWASPEARKASAVADIAACAILVGNPVSRVVAGFFIQLNQPPYPTRVFSDGRAALTWLREHLPR